MDRAWNTIVLTCALSCVLAACARVHSTPADSPHDGDVSDASQPDASDADASVADAPRTAHRDAGVNAAMSGSGAHSRDAAPDDEDVDDEDVPDEQPPGCTAGLGRVAGDYREADGSEHWFRASITASVHVRVPGGPIAQQALPELRVVTAVCERHRYLLWRDASGAVRRDDFRRDGNALALCTNPALFDSSREAQTATSPGATDDEDGCFGAPWLSLTAKEAP